LTTKRRLLKGIIDTSMIAATSTWVRGLSEEFGLMHEDLYRIDLCFAELVTNVVNYSEAKYANLPLELHAVIEEQRISLTLIDPAQAYDPLCKPPPPSARTIEELQVGGQGIRLVREFCDAHRYERSDGKNRIELVFNLAAPAKAPKRGMLVSRDLERRCGAAQTVFPLLCDDGARIEKDRRGKPDRRAKGYLSWAQIFRNVPYSALEELVDRFPIQSISAVTTVLKPGDLNSEVLIVLDGRLKIYLNQPGTGDFIEIGAGGCVGEMSVIDNQPVSAYAIAEEGTSLLLVDAASFLNDVMTIPKVSRNLMSALSERLRRSNEHVIKRVRKELEMEHVQRELQYARSIQKSLLPKEPLFPDDSRLDCVGRMCAAREVGGDFYDVFSLDPQRIFFVIGDVCGKGLPAALFMVRALAALRAQSGRNDRPADSTEQTTALLNQQLCAHNDAKQFLTAFCGILDLETLTVHYVNAGHNAPLLALGAGPFAYLAEPINPIVGMIEGIEYRAGEVKLTPQSVLLLYTDGVTEAEDNDVNMLGEERLLACLNAAPTRKAGDLVESVFAEVNAFAGDAPQSDDITVLALRLAGAGRSKPFQPTGSA
jgi:serine phosphatase RsbU (regulator of sigma subunit)/anti-sigma regulatory factor (Ser/Thr protein kinase)